MCQPLGCPQHHVPAPGCHQHHAPALGCLQHHAPASGVPNATRQPWGVPKPCASLRASPAPCTSSGVSQRCTWGVPNTVYQLLVSLTPCTSPGMSQSHAAALGCRQNWQQGQGGVGTQSAEPRTALALTMSLASWVLRGVAQDVPTSRMGHHAPYPALPGLSGSLPTVMPASPPLGASSTTLPSGTNASTPTGVFSFSPVNMISAVKQKSAFAPVVRPQTSPPPACASTSSSSLQGETSAGRAALPARDGVPPAPRRGFPAAPCPSRPLPTGCLCSPACAPA